ncbi:MAG: hypothetical protein ACTH2P_11110 [Oceanisphaera sp.]
MNKEIKVKLVYKPLFVIVVSIIFCFYIVGKLPEGVGFYAKLFLAFPFFGLVRNLVYIKLWRMGKIPSCPTCRNPMRKHLAKRGVYKGQYFWGCILFPKCRGKYHVG